MPTFTLGPHLPGANMLPNGSFEDGTTAGMAIVQHQMLPTASGVVNTGWAAHGTRSLRFAGNKDANSPELGGYGHYQIVYWPTIPVVPGNLYTFSFTVNFYDLAFPEAGVGVAARTLFYDAGGAVPHYVDTWSPGVLGVSRVASPALAPSTAVSMSPQFYFYCNGPYEFYVDALMLTRGSGTTYGDGSFAGWSWAGTANNSISAPTPKLVSPKLSLTTAPPYVLDSFQGEIAKENWVRAGLLTQTA